MPRIKRNIKISDRLLRYLQSYANTSATIEKILNCAELEGQVDVGEYTEDSYEFAEWIAQELIRECRITGIVDEGIIAMEREYVESKK